MNPDNECRADRALTALEHYVVAKGDVLEKSSTEIVDLITDLLHLAARIDEGHDPVESTVHLALMHFEAEQGGPE
jgi:hypothetical protein